MIDHRESDLMFDGIGMQNHSLPRWWKTIFIFAATFGVCYMAYFHSGAPKRSIYGAYDAHQLGFLEKQLKELGELPSDRATLLSFLSDEKWLKFGQGTFKTNCQSCHGTDGGGVVGPNLTDDRWKNIKHIEDIAKVVADGAGGAAMPAWKTRLRPNEIVLVSAYVASLLGSSPVSPKSPDGANVIANWNEDINSVPQIEKRNSAKNTKPNEK